MQMSVSPKMIADSSVDVREYRLTPEQFQVYMFRLETEFLPRAITKNVIGSVEDIPVKPGKLSRLPYGRLMGDTILTEDPFAIDYYGHLKRSTGLLNMNTWVRQQMGGRNYQIKAVQGYLVHFASIKIEHVARITPHLVAEFPLYKQIVLEARGFKISIQEQVWQT